MSFQGWSMSVFGRSRARSTIEHRRNRQKPPRLCNILRPLRKLPNLTGRIVRSNRNCLAHGKHPPFAILNHAERDSKIPVRIYLTAILADTAENIPSGTLDHKCLETAYRDFCADTVGGIRNAAHQMSEHETWRAS